MSIPAATNGTHPPVTDPTATKPVGYSGLPIYGYQVLDEWDARLKGRKWIETVREMAEGDPTIHAFLFAFETTVRAAGHRIDESELESPESADAQAFIEDAIQDMDGAWGDQLSEILSALAFGFSLFEVVLKRRDDGRLGWERWAPRAQETIIGWDWDEQDIATHAVQQGPPKYRTVHISLEPSTECPGGCLHVRIRPRKQNPYGTSLLRSSYNAWYFSKHIERLEAIGIERDFVGIPKITIPNEAYDDTTIRQSWIDLATGMTKDEVSAIVLPSTVDDTTKTPKYTFELVSSAGTRLIDTDAVLARYQRQKLNSVLAAVFDLGANGVGSYALGTTLSDRFVQAVKALLEGIQDSINIVVKRLCKLNGIADEHMPTFVFNEVGSREIKVFAETLLGFVTAGIVDPSDPDLKAHVYEALGLPMPKDDTTVLPVEKPRIPAQPVQQPIGAPLPETQPKVPALPTTTPLVASDRGGFHIGDRVTLRGNEGTWIVQEFMGVGHIGLSAEGDTLVTHAVRPSEVRRFIAPSEVDDAVNFFDRAIERLDRNLVGVLNAEVV